MNDAGKGGQVSRTAQWVAAARSVGALLPEELVLARDPYGVGFAEGGSRKLADALLRRPALARRLLTRAGPLTSFVLWMQLRTRALDDVLLDFTRAGGRQIVLLGAGYDGRSLRFGRELRHATLYEVDQRATQVRKIKLLPAEPASARVVYVSWDFERDEMAELPARLHQHGLAPELPVLTIWEGVTMYLGPSAIAATLRAVHALGASASLLAFTYIDRRALAAPKRELKLFARMVAGAGEPWRFGWRPPDLPGWLSARGFSLLSDVSDAELSARFFPAAVWHHFAAHHRLAIAETRAPAAPASP